MVEKNGFCARYRLFDLGEFYIEYFLCVCVIVKNGIGYGVVPV